MSYVDIRDNILNNKAFRNLRICQVNKKGFVKATDKA